MVTIAARAGAASVLVVEDNAEVRRSVVDVLELHGFHVTTACNGIQALRALEDAAAVPDVILLDLELPFMSGWQLLRDLAGNPELAAVPVIVVSAHEIPRSGIAGAVCVLLKPLIPAVMVAALRKCLAARLPPVSNPKECTT